MKSTTDTLRARILATDDRRGVIIRPKCMDGDEAEVVMLTVRERWALMGEMMNGNSLRNAAVFEADLVIYTLRDPATREPIFTLEDRDALLSLPSETLDELAEPSLRLNGLLINGDPANPVPAITAATTPPPDPVATDDAALLPH